MDAADGEFGYVQDDVVPGAPEHDVVELLLWAAAMLRGSAYLTGTLGRAVRTRLS